MSDKGRDHERGARMTFIEHMIFILRARLEMLESVKERDAGIVTRIGAVRRALARLERSTHDRAA